jgi:hypothetical protein
MGSNTLRRANMPGGPPRRATKRARGAGVVLTAMSLIVLLNGCHGCDVKRLKGRATYRAHYWNTPRCVSDSDCTAGCLPGDAMCAMVGMIEDDIRVCFCKRFQRVPNADGGAPVFKRCVVNPDGRTSICGEWDEHRGVLVGEDGGVVVENDGGAL